MYRIADLHCHPQGRPFNFYRNNPSYLNEVPMEFKDMGWQPWVLPPRDHKGKNWFKQLDGKRPGSFAQSDFNRLAIGNVRLVFCSLYPLETGFVKGKTSKGFFGKIVNTLLKPISDVAANSFIRTLFQSLQMKYPKDRILFFQGKQKDGFNKSFDYWDELLYEYYFIATQDGVQQTHDFRFYKKDTLPLEINIDDEVAYMNHYEEEVFKMNHQYVIAQSNQHLRSLLLDEHQLKNTIVAVLTIEGGHVLSKEGTEQVATWEVIHTRLLQLKNWGLQPKGIPLKEDLKSMDTIKNWATDANAIRKNHPIFILNLSHHFNNFLAAHARSIPDKLRLLMDQSEGMKIGVSSLGRKVIECCLNIERVQKNGAVSFSQTAEGHRILLDVKHLNPAARKILYYEYILPYNQQYPNDAIPIVATHVAFVGDNYLTLDALDEEEISSIAVDLFKPNARNGYTIWGINLCKEDIQAICKSKGMIALAIDQRILGNATGKSDSRDFIRNLKYVVQTAKLNHFCTEQIGDSIWDLLSIASDFDGFIDPIDTCPSAMHYNQWLDTLTSLFDSEPLSFFMPYNKEQCLQKLAWQNAVDFTVKYFPH
jgi:microsomal dipeptidase-like Zn-dependent dipeptidase